MNERLAALLDAGLLLWAAGPVPDLATLVAEDGVTGAVRDAAAVRDAMTGDAPDAEAAIVADARSAADLLLPVYRASGGADGLVSADLDPGLAPDAAATVEAAVRLADRVDRPNLLVKVPATGTGTTAITELLGAGIGVNATLVYGGDRFRAALEAVLTGLERSARPSAVPSAVSMALSEVDTDADKRLWKIGTDRSAALRGRLAVAAARLAYGSYAELLGGARWSALERAGARAPRLVWSSTRARDPYYSDTLYVDGLVAPGIVTALERTTLDHVKEGGDFDGRTIPDCYADARATVAEFAAVGVDHDDVIAVLEAQGLRRLEAAYAALHSAAGARAVRTAT